MTCIVGIQTPDGVLIGGDSSGISNSTRFHRADPKVFENGPYVIGYTTSFRMGQLIRYADLPKPLDRSGEELFRFMVTEFVEAIRKVLKDGGFASKDKEQETGGTFLIAVNGQLLEIDSDYQVDQSLDSYTAVGDGREVALGALRATRDLDVPPASRIMLALEAAAYHNTGVHGPFTVRLSRSAKESP